jgi:hypothetical protein
MGASLRHHTCVCMTGTRKETCCMVDHAATRPPQGTGHPASSQHMVAGMTHAGVTTNPLTQWCVVPQSAAAVHAG